MNRMGRLKLTVAYLGAGFSGWQRQVRGRTVQGDLESCLTRLDRGAKVTVVGAGRTDAGVHAAAQVAHVDFAPAIPTGELPKIMNARLRPDLRVRSAVAVPDGFHARIDARGKHYAYRVRFDDRNLPWLGLRAAVLPAITARSSFERACRMLPGRRDWASFTVPEVAARPTVRSLYRLDLKWRREGVDLHFFGEGFLRYQVRRMVGALLEVGRDRLDIAAFAELVESPSPGAPLLTAPARGLTLERVYYRRAPKLSSESETVPTGEASSLW